MIVGQENGEANNVRGSQEGAGSVWHGEIFIPPSGLNGPPGNEDMGGEDICPDCMNKYKCPWCGAELVGEEMTGLDCVDRCTVCDFEIDWDKPPANIGMPYWDNGPDDDKPDDEWLESEYEDRTYSEDAE